MPVTEAEAIARMQAKLAELHHAGAQRVLIYGAGRHTLKVGAALGRSPVGITGIVDDHLGGRDGKLWNWPILSPEEARHVDAHAIVISSDGAESALLEKARSQFAETGIPIHCLYGSDRQTPHEETPPVFHDRDGVAFTPIPGYRRKVKSGWEEMLAAPPGATPEPTAADIQRAFEEAQSRVHNLQKLLAIHGGSLEGRNVLEIGCWDGASCYALLMAGARRVTGIDYQDYYLWNVEPDAITDDQRAAARASLLRLQSAARDHAIASGLQTDRAATHANLHIADFHTNDLPDDTFDLICSWQTLEHVIPPERTFEETYRLLKPGGLCFHQYSAFTNREGGHALCTFDFPWGHLRLGAEDVDRYLKQYRPAEYAHAIRHYRHFLNRLTLHDVDALCRQFGLEQIHRAIWLDRAAFAEFDVSCLQQARRHYPGLTMEDMVHESIWQLLRKPMNVNS